MKYFVNSELSLNRPLRAILAWSLVFMALFWITNWLFYLRIGLAPEQIALYYRGSEAAFRPPRSFYGLLEESHFHLFAMMIFLMTLNHLLVFTRTSPAGKQWLIHLSFTGALLDIAGGWLIRYVHADFTWLKAGAFLLLQGATLLVLIRVAHGLWKPGAVGVSRVGAPEQSR